MITLSQLFNIHGENVTALQIPLCHNIFPEIDLDYDDQVLTALDDDKRLTFQVVINQDIDGYRYATMFLVRFEGAPLLVVQKAGRSGRDHFKRWRVASDDVYGASLTYLLSLQRAQCMGLRDDMDKPLFEEEVFEFYGNYWGNQLGFPPEERTPMEIYRLEELVEHHEQAPDEYLVVERSFTAGQPPYIRRGGYVMKLQGELSEAELDKMNPRIRVVLSEKGQFCAYKYKHEAQYPETAVIVSV